MEDVRKLCDHCGIYPARKPDYKDNSGCVGVFASCQWCYDLNDEAIKKNFELNRNPAWDLDLSDSSIQSEKHYSYSDLQELKEGIEKTQATHFDEEIVEQYNSIVREIERRQNEKSKTIQD